MASAGLLTLLDDIATVLDDVAILSKVAAKKTAGVLGDDLALNAEQVSGVKAERELPVIWAVAKGSFKNKLILVPAALAISMIAPWLIIPLLMLGGLYLCYEGFEKVYHALFHADDAENETHHQEMIHAIADSEVDMVAFEEEKIKGAIRTDFILSAEIIVIALGTAKDASFAVQAAVVSGIAIAMTIGVYTLVAGILKMDDAGLHLIKETATNAWGSFKRGLGKALLNIAPYLMKTLSVVGTAAMFLVGGGIILHGFHATEAWIKQASEWVASSLPVVGDALAFMTPTIINGIAGVIIGGIALVIMTMGTGVYKKIKG